MHKNTPFFQVGHTVHKTSAGEVELPIAYHDNSHLVAVFSVPVEPVRSKLRAEGLVPVVLGGKAQVALVFFEYASSSIGQYNEVGLASLVALEGKKQPSLPVLEMLRNPRKRHVGMYVHNLPVTTKEACAAGRELWGYPKFVTEIPISWGKRDFRGAVLDPSDGSVMLELSGQRSLGVPMPAPGLLTYSRLGNQRLQTPVDVRGRATAARAGSMRLHVGKSQHDMAKNLRDFGLDGAVPSLVIDARHAWSLLYGGEPLGGAFVSSAATSGAQSGSERAA